ncbi:MAG: D-serine ammonia-lyase [Bacillaceae bacterium]|nr:D-serine ammonia-lyase [Bacillaceae bacterium]
MTKKIHGKTVEEWQNEFPLLKDIMDLKPVFWVNHRRLKMKDIPSLPLSLDDILAAEKLFERFHPFFKKAFPETKKTNGVIESPLTEIPNMKKRLGKERRATINGRLFVKQDNALPITGSIKARGGFFEVLHYAEQLALDAGLISRNDNYEKFSEPEMKEFFSQFTIGVGSTGNLGLSIGTMAAVLGFNVNVYMSRDAKEWKKELLRKRGAAVHEFDGDFSEAIDEGRRKTQADPKGYFVDDEKSKYLFLGYSVAALRLKEQLKENQIHVDEDHPLFVYLPCGVGGSPGGITFGLKQLFGDDVHCFLVEPTHSPAVLLGMLTGLGARVSVQDFGLDNRTEADGLAVGRPSAFASSFLQKLASGVYTIEDHELLPMLSMLQDEEGIFVEPSATAGFPGPVRLQNTNYIDANGLANKMNSATHIVWATGGSLVPHEYRKHYLSLV